jgi:hypothetical protein
VTKKKLSKIKKHQLEFPRHSEPMTLKNWKNQRSGVRKITIRDSSQAKNSVISVYALKA